MYLPNRKFFFLALLLCFFGCDMLANLSADQAHSKGQEKAKAGDRQAAFRFFTMAAQKAPDSAQYQWAAAVTAPDKEAARSYTIAAWKNGLKTPEILFSMVLLSLQTKKSERLAYARELFQELPDAQRSAELYGDIFFRFEEYDSALSYWGPLSLTAPTASLCNKLGMLYSHKKNLDAIILTMRTCQAQKILDRQGYTILANAYVAQNNIDKIDTLFSEANAAGLYNASLRLEHAALLVAYMKFDKAQSILTALKEPVAEQMVPAFVSQRSRSLLSFIYGTRKEPQQIKSLYEMIDPKTPTGKAEAMLYDAEILMLKGDTSARSKLVLAQRALDADPIATLLCAREFSKSGDYEKALSFYQQLPSSFGRAPHILIEVANALIHLGKDDEALVVISSLHGRGQFSRTSLEMFRDLAFRKKLLEKAEAAQQVLQKQYGTDINVRWSGALIALRKGNTDSAAAIISKLSQEYPTEERFENARISILLLKGDFIGVLKACSTSALPATALAPLKARALVKLNRPSEAQMAYIVATKGTKNPRLILEYADFLALSGKNAEAARLLKDLIDNPASDTMMLDSIETAGLLNNFAWEGLQAGMFDQKILLDAIKRAHKVMPNNPNILDTYCGVLKKSEKFKDIIGLLENNPAIKKEPALLIHLGEAFEKSNNINRAVRTYQEAILQWGTQQNVKPTLTKEQLQSVIDKLNVPLK